MPSGLRDSGWEILVEKVKKQKWKVSDDDRDSELDNFFCYVISPCPLFLHVDVYFLSARCDFDLLCTLHDLQLLIVNRHCSGEAGQKEC